MRVRDKYEAGSGYKIYIPPSVGGALYHHGWWSGDGKDFGRWVFAWGMTYRRRPTLMSSLNPTSYNQGFYII